ncbi:MAG: hypothetical protein PVJ40_01775 [Gammaproteobacteria bacterium]|jgi:hypothetical protein
MQVAEESSIHAPAWRGGRRLAEALDSGLAAWRRSAKAASVAGLAGTAGLILVRVQLVGRLALGSDMRLHLTAGMNLLGWLAAGGGLLLALLAFGWTLRLLPVSRPSLLASLRTALRRFPALLVAMLIYLVLTLGLPFLAGLLAGGRWMLVLAAMLTLEVVALWLSVSLIFHPFAVMEHDAGPLAALNASHRRVRGRWWWSLLGTSVATTVPVLLYLGVTVVTGGLLGAWRLVGGGPAWLDTLNWLVQWLVGGFLFPMGPALLAGLWWSLADEAQPR